MKTIYNKIIPFKGFKAMAIYPFLFVRGVSVSKKTLRHEFIHFEQQKELLIVGFYVLYFIYWIMYGYRNIPFEREARYGENMLMYEKERNRFAWVNFFVRK